MPYDASLAVRIRAVLAAHPAITERQMFGGLAVLAHGHMCCGIVGDTLMVRVGPDAYAAALARPHAREMDFTGRPMRGLVYVDPPGFRAAASLRAWIGRGLAFTDTLPPRSGPRPRGPRRAQR